MVYVFLAEGFEEIEAITPVDILRRAKIPVTTVAVSNDNKTVSGSKKIPVVADILIKDVSLTDLDMAVLPGGQPGADHLCENDEVKRIVRFASEHGKYVAAICAAPYILGRLGLLDGKKATCYPGYEGELKGAKVSLSEKTICDGKIITGRGPGAASEFAFKLVELIKDQAESDSVRKAMLY